MTASVAQDLHAKALTVSALAGPVPSPCISICKMSPDSQLCVGCYRTLDEIIAWSRSDDSTKKQVWQAISQRVQTERPCAP